MSVAELTAAYAKGSLSRVEAAHATSQRAEDINPRYNAFVSIDHEDALIAAKASEDRWRAGAPTVARLKLVGATLIGLTTTPEPAWKAVTASRLSGVTSNPWNGALTPGAPTVGPPSPRRPAPASCI